MTGKMYPTDVMVMSIDDENKTFVSAVDDLIKVLSNCTMLQQVIIAADLGSFRFLPL
jgi:hypothetical protein